MIEKIHINKSVLQKGLLYFLVLFVYVQYVPLAHATVNPIGQQDTLVMLLNFEENPNEQPISLNDADTLVFSEINNFYKENSYGKTWLDGQVIGWYTLPLSNQVCDTLSVQIEADKMAQSDGITLEDYDRIVYIMTGNGCVTGGSATSGKTNPSRTYINGTLSTKVIAHELGHNMGLSHAKALDCGDASLGDNCTIKEYGDSYDVMGGYDMGYINAFYKERMGWINDSASPKIITAVQDGTYQIAEYETQNINQNIALKIPRGVNSNTGKNEWFYVEYRQAAGFDQFLDARSYMLFRGDVTEGVIIRLAEEGSDDSYILHSKPDSEYSIIYGMKDWKDTALPVGDSFIDLQSGITLNLIRAGNGIAEVNLSFSGVSNVCEISAPILSAKAITSSEINAGDTVTYQLMVTNTANELCGSLDFDVTTEVESDWQGSQTITLASGESKEVNVSVTSDLNAVPGSYEITLNAISVTEPSYNASANVSYSVIEQASDNNDVVAVNDSVLMTDITPVKIYVLNNDIIDDGVTVEISAISDPNKGTVTLLADGSVQYVPAKRFKDQDSFTYTISGAGISSTAMVNLTLQSPSSSGSSPGKGKKK